MRWPVRTWWLCALLSACAPPPVENGEPDATGIQEESGSSACVPTVCVRACQRIGAGAGTCADGLCLCVAGSDGSVDAGSPDAATDVPARMDVALDTVDASRADAPDAETVGPVYPDADGVRSCVTNAQCPPSMFCDNPAACGMPGYCALRGVAGMDCPDAGVVSCGCDGVLHVSACARRRAGVRANPVSSACVRRDGGLDGGG